MGSRLKVRFTQLAGSLLIFTCSHAILSANDGMTVRVTQFDPSNFPYLNVYVAVESQMGQPVLGLAGANFKIRENGNLFDTIEARPALELVEDEFSHLTVALVIDNSTSMQSEMRLVQEAILQFINNLRSQDRLAIVAFSNTQNQQKLHARLLHDFSNVKYSLRNRARILELIDRTFLYDATFHACQLLERQETLGRKALIVLSDGEDHWSRINIKYLINKATTLGVPIYTINFKALAVTRTLNQMSSATGGAYFFAKSAEDLNSVYSSILNQLQGQYRLSYKTDENSWNLPSRDLEIEVNWQRAIARSSRKFDADQARMGFLNILYKEKMVLSAENDYLNYISTFPLSEWRDDVQFKLGVFYEEKGDYDAAIKIFDQLSLLPESEWQDDVLFHKGKIYEQKGEFQKAINFYEQMVSAYPAETKTPESLLGLARSHRELGQTQSARDMYLKLKNEYAGSDVTDDALLELSYLEMNAGNPVEAKAILDELVEKYPNSNCAVHAHYELASFYQQAGNFQLALSECDQAVAATTDQKLIAKSFCKKGEIYQTLQNWDDAIDQYNRIIQSYAQNGYDDKAYYGLAIAHRAKNNYRSMCDNYYALETMSQQGAQINFDLHEINKVKDIIPPIEGGWVATLSGARLSIPVETMTFPLNVKIESIPTPETAQSFAIAGKVYDFTANIDTFYHPVQIALPYQTTWLDDPEKTLDGFKLYSFERGEWREVPGSQIDSTDQVVYANVTHLSLKVIMYKKPVVLRFTDVLFDFGKADLTLAALAQLDTVLELMQTSAELKVEIAGHTDDVGSDDANQILSQRRSESIKNALTDRGIDSVRIIAQGYGEKYPVVSNETEDGRRYNRRTEFIIISKGEHDIIDAAQKQRATQKFSIQLGHHSLLNRAYEQEEFFRKRGFAIDVIERKADGRPYYLVCTGLYDAREVAEQEAEKIKSEYKNINAIVIER